MQKINLGTNVTREDGLIQASFTLRDIHCQSGALVVHTLEGNIVPLPASDFTGFTDALSAAVKSYLLSPPAPEPIPATK